jgi:3'-phosphoadenosine 5'-phosphosulfate (PAPS) 3'-phosphatase
MTGLCSAAEESSLRQEMQHQANSRRSSASSNAKATTLFETDLEIFTRNGTYPCQSEWSIEEGEEVTRGAAW